MKQYLELLQHVLDNGEERQDRTGVGTLSIFGAQVRYDLRKGFPLVTTKKVFWKGVVEELLWFLRGSTNVRSLQKKGVHIWDEWSDQYGRLGPIYGRQWRRLYKFRTCLDELDDGFIYIDQIANVIQSIKDNPHSRRHLVSAWNVSDLDEMALPPCHFAFQFYVSNKKELSCQLYQRSGDIFIGIPFNIASYALLTHMIAQVCGLGVGELIHTIGDLHLYLNHIDQAKEQLSREPLPLPTLRLNKSIMDIDDFTSDDIELINYNSHPTIKASVAV